MNSAYCISAHHLFYIDNGKFPYNGEVYSYPTPNNLIQQNAQYFNIFLYYYLGIQSHYNHYLQQVFFSLNFYFLESFVYPTQVDPTYIQPSQPPIISPYFSQGTFNPYNQFRIKTPLQPLQQYSYGMLQPSVKSSSSLLNSPSTVSQIPNMINPSVDTEEAKEKESTLTTTSELEETKEMK